MLVRNNRKIEVRDVVTGRTYVCFASTPENALADCYMAHPGTDGSVKNLEKAEARSRIRKLGDMLILGSLMADRQSESDRINRRKGIESYIRFRRMGYELLAREILRDMAGIREI